MTLHLLPAGPTSTLRQSREWTAEECRLLAVYRRDLRYSLTRIAALLERTVLDVRAQAQRDGLPTVRLVRGVRA